MDAVAVGQFAMLQAVFEVHFVFFEVTFLIRFLDAASGGRVVVGDGQPYHGTVGQIHGTLHKAFTERTAAHDRAAVLILNGS